MGNLTVTRYLSIAGKITLGDMYKIIDRSEEGKVRTYHGLLRDFYSHKLYCYIATSNVYLSRFIYFIQMLQYNARKVCNKEI